jgi:hypothetical protein
VLGKPVVLVLDLVRQLARVAHHQDADLDGELSRWIEGECGP